MTECCRTTTIHRMVGKQGGENPSEVGGPPRLYNRIAVLRLERGLSRQALADLVGVNHQTVGYLERGDYNPSLELAFRLSEVFALPIEAIFSRTPPCWVCMRSVSSDRNSPTRSTSSRSRKPLVAA